MDKGDEIVPAVSIRIVRPVVAPALPARVIPMVQMSVVCNAPITDVNGAVRMF